MVTIYCCYINSQIHWSALVQQIAFRRTIAAYIGRISRVFVKYLYIYIQLNRWVYMRYDIVYIQFYVLHLPNFYVHFYVSIVHPHTKYKLMKTKLRVLFWSYNDFMWALILIYLPSNNNTRLCKSDKQDVSSFRLSFWLYS